MAGELRDYDAAAATWDTNLYRVRLARDVARTIRERIQLGPSMDVLEIGCGTGLLTLLLQPHVRSITALDSSAGMLGILESRIRDDGIFGITTRLMDLEGEDAWEGNYDLVVSSMTLHHIHNVPHLIHQCFSVLKPGGTLAIADLDSECGMFHKKTELVYHEGFDRSLLKREFWQAGFGNIRNCTAAMPVKPDCCGDLRCFSVFLMTGQKNGNGDRPQSVRKPVEL